ncbi:glutaredoxin family protein [Methylomicrobium lacus]|uniref:glutaredoxin family protein n=1 Tax=Methylomicrobium lacus TaxID=136992 RepID=UPI0004A4B718|nr:glutaredoxin family protein [Methylomicrobium lacus]
MRLLLLGTEGCHLCEEAQEIVAACVNEIAPETQIELIDIAEQPEWQPDYAIKIPVLLEPESRRELGWPFDYAQAASFLQQFD